MSMHNKSNQWSLRLNVAITNGRSDMGASYLSTIGFLSYSGKQRRRGRMVRVL